jgi:hypothetical protein
MADPALLEKIEWHDPIKSVLYGEVLNNNFERQVSVQADVTNMQKSGRQQLDEVLSGKDELRDAVIKVLAKVEAHTSELKQKDQSLDTSAYMDAAQGRLAQDIASGKFQKSLEDFAQVQVAENDQRANSTRSPLPADWAQKSAVVVETVHVERDLDQDFSR